MDRRVFYLILTALWFTFAGYIALVADWKNGRPLAVAISILFGLYNLIRFLLESRRTSRRQEAPTEVLPDEARNPEFDFDVQEKKLDERTGQGP